MPGQREASAHASESVEVLAAELRKELERAVDADFREGQQNFFQHEVDTWGVRSDALQRLSREAWPVFKSLPVAKRNELCTLLWESGKLEEGILVVYLYSRLAKTCGECEFKLFERWIDRYVHNWATCDAVSTKLIAASLANQPALIRNLPAWTRARNRWKRRAAAVSLVWEGKRERHLPEILEIADLLLEDPDDMVQKGVGWMLKDAFPAKPKEIASYWETNAVRAPALVLRIASEKMPRELVLRLRVLRQAG